MQKIRMRKSERFNFEGTKMAKFFSRKYPGAVGFLGELVSLEIKIIIKGEDSCSFQVLTLDLTFAEKERRFQGLIDVFHRSSWITESVNVHSDLRQVNFFFPERGDGGQEALVAYVNKFTLLQLCKNFIC